MPAPYQRLARSLVLLVLAILWSLNSHPSTLSTKITSQAGESVDTRAASRDILPAIVYTKANDDPQVGNRPNSTPTGSPYVDAHVECGVTEDGLSDDGPAINACLQQNAGKHIMLRKRGPSNAGGGTPTSVDIYSGETITMVGDAQHLDCEVPSLWGGGCRINFDPHLTGPGIAVPPTAYGVEISNLELWGGNCWAPTNLATYVLPPRINGWGNDGILLAGGEPKLENVIVACFKRHGIQVAGDSVAYAAKENGYSQPDFFRFERVEVDGNRGYGVYVVGGDSNAGLVTFIDARDNQLGGIYDFSVLGNTWIAPGMHTNTRSPIKSGDTQAIKSISVRGNIATITTADAFARGVGTIGTWVTTTGSIDNGFDGTCKIAAVNEATKQLSCNFAHVDGLTTGGMVGTASSTSVYDAYAATDDGSGNARKWKIAGPYSGRGGSSSQVVINPYCESDEQTSDFGNRTLVLGGNCWMLDTKWGHGGVRPSPGGLAFDGDDFLFQNHGDHSMYFDLRAGTTINPIQFLRFLDKDGKPRWRISVSAEGNLRFDNGGSLVPLETTGERTVIGGVAYVDERGKGTFPGGVSTSSLSGVTSTAPVPNLNADMVDGQHLTLAKVSFSAAPAFDANKASTFKITLAGGIASSTLSGAASGQLLNFIICQDGAGNHSFQWPSNVKGGMIVGTAASKCSAQTFVFDGTDAYAVSSGVVDE
jgi:hypothetical protein